MKREVTACVAKDAPCYGNFNVDVPDDVPDEKVAEWFRENAARLAEENGVVYEPEWSYMDGFRVIDAQLLKTTETDAIHSDDELYTDTEFPEGLPSHDVGNLAKEVVGDCEDEIIKSNLSRATVMRLLALIGKGE